jgi:hypothetical protein
LTLSDFDIYLVLLQLRSSGYIETQGPTCGSAVVETLYTRVLMTRSSK